MRVKRQSLACAVGVLALSLLACDLPFPTSSGPPATVTPYAAPTATESPTEAPAESPAAGWLPEDTILLYASGSWESPQLYALTIGTVSVDLGRTLGQRAALSRTGLWIAYPDSSPPASAVVVANLADGTTYNVPLTPDYGLYDMAFDPAETRLAFMELGPLGAEGTSWAVVVISLADGSTARFDAVLEPDSAMLPGRPIGWSASGDELLLDAFMPGTEGGWAGVWGIALPPGAASAPISTLTSRELVPLGSYFASPRLSPDAARLLYLNRDFGYTPTGYAPMAYDLAVNQLWSLDLASGAPTSLVDVTDGGALARDAAWSQEAPSVLFAQGNYAGDTFDTLTLRIHDSSAVSDFAPMPLPPGGDLRSIAWCRSDLAFVTVTDASYDYQLQVVEIGSGAPTTVASAPYISILGCIP